VKISDRLLKRYLENVYWVCGGPCGGKSTMTSAIASKWGMIPYSSDDYTLEYQKKANPQDHPAILRHFIDWEWYFLGRGNDRSQWLNNAFDESVEFILLDLLQMGKGQSIIVDTFMEPEFLKTIADHHRIVYVFAEDDLIRSEYLTRDHLSGMEKLFPTLSDPQHARSDTLDIVVKGSNHYFQKARQHGLQYFVRDASTTKEDMLASVEKHFQLT
jgi:adenylate kinase family enzyme